jgi:alpha-tubulin suppressor-like RCC1 family protein
MAVSGITDATAVATGSRHTCAVLADGTIKCWGSNGIGQLGDGTLAVRMLPVAVAGITDATAVAAGFQHSCGLRATGALECWGDNQSGQLGANPGWSPVKVVGMP